MDMTAVVGNVTPNAAEKKPERQRRYRIGAHVSIRGGITKAFQRATTLDIDVFQLFTRNPRGWNAKDIAPIDIERIVGLQRIGKPFCVASHLPYLANFCSANNEVYRKSVDALMLEISRCESLTIPNIVAHVGYNKERPDEGFKSLVRAVQQALERLEQHRSVSLLLENGAGQKGSIGSKTEELRRLLQAVEETGTSSRQLGFCLDTCHAHAAGYDLSSHESINKSLACFADDLGQERIKLVHLNDSKGAAGSGIDRHQHIGMGTIGKDGFKYMLGETWLPSKPLILETPMDEQRDDMQNLQVVRDLLPS